jgi:hypothetical protein
MEVANDTVPISEFGIKAVDLFPCLCLSLDPHFQVLLIRTGSSKKRQKPRRNKPGCRGGAHSERNKPGWRSVVLE